MPKIDAKQLNLEETVVKVTRVAKVVKGGKRFNFRALVVVGDRNGHVGMGLGKAAEVPEAIRKATEDARKRLIAVPLIGTTIPYMVKTKFSTAEVMLKPAAPGTGVIAGGAVRAVVEAAGIRDILTKSDGHSSLNTVTATLKALKELYMPEQIAARRNRSLVDLVGPKMAARYQAAAAQAAATSTETERSDRSAGRPRNDRGGDRRGGGGSGGGGGGSRPPRGGQGQGAAQGGSHGPGPVNRQPQTVQPPMPINSPPASVTPPATTGEGASNNGQA